MGNLDLYDKFRSVPNEAKKSIQAGRLKGKTDINPMWRIKALTEAFGPCGIGWYYKPVNKWMERQGEEVAAFVDIELYVKYEGEWSKPISGTGGSMFVVEEKKGLYVSDECYKMATTDAISVACKQLGFGADVYWSSDRSKYDSPGVQDPQGAQQPEYETDPNKALVQNVHINTIFTELARTGIGMKSMLSRYNLNDIHNMTMAQFSDAMAILKSRPDKPDKEPPMAPPDNVDDPSLPWNTPSR